MQNAAFTVLMMALLATTDSFAMDLNGRMNAKDGELFTDQGWSSGCSTFEFEFEESPGELVVGGGNIDCGGTKLTLPQLVFVNKDGELYYNGQKQGRLSATGLHIRFGDASTGKTSYSIDTSEGKSGLEFKGFLGSLMGRDYTFTGTLQKAN